MPAITPTTKGYILGVSSGALAIAAYAFTGFAVEGLGALALWTAVAGISATMKIGVPGAPGNISLTYVALVWGTVNLQLAETIVMGLAAGLVQTCWRRAKRPQAIQVMFNLALMTVSIGAAWGVFSTPLFRDAVPSFLLRLGLAASAYFLANTATVTGVIALSEGRSPVEVWMSSFLWTFPHYLVSASFIGAAEYVKRALGIEAALLMLPAVYLVYHTFVLHVERLNQVVERAKQQKRHADETAELHLRTIRALALAIEAKDQTTGEHLHRVHTYAMELGKDLGLPNEEMEALSAAAILHDVGKLAVPEHIISKPAKLTPAEFGKMKIHTVVGAEIVESVRFPFAVAPLVRSHHEKWDGSGYPDGLAGENIPMGARILSAVDCLDALASDRQYRKAMPLDKAMSIVAAESGKSFDPRVVDALSRRYVELERKAKETLHTGAVKLSIDATVERGAAPDAGYAAGSTAAGSGIRTSEAAAELESVNRIHAYIGRSESLEADLREIADCLRSVVPFECLALFRVRGETIECIHADGAFAADFQRLCIPMGVGVSGWVASNRTPLLNGNAATEFPASRPVPAGFSLASGLSIPLESDAGATGVLTLYSKQRDAFESSHLRTLMAIGSRIGHQMRLDLAGVPRQWPPPPAPEVQLAGLAGLLLAQSGPPVHEPLPAVAAARVSARS